MHRNFFATCQLRNNKSNRLYTGKFSIRIDLATEKDKYYEIDRWAKLFTVATWEGLKMIAKNDPQLPFHTLRMPKESGASGEISSTPRR